ncbi:MAG TPA: hypothetical protein VMM37_01610 [Bacteroidota bacterium]|nr:hypothetical protein [Bacteroidota bacterium]
MAIRLHKKNHRLILLILVACYFLTGMESSSPASSFPDRGAVGSHSTSRNTGTKSKSDNRPYWTSHKHEPEKSRLVSGPLAFLTGSPFGHINRTVLILASPAASSPAGRRTENRPGRAPPFRVI